MLGISYIYRITTIYIYIYMNTHCTNAYYEWNLIVICETNEAYRK